MSTFDSFPQFSRLPPELRILVWGFACRSGPMRLSLRNIWHTNGRRYPGQDPGCFLLASCWRAHVSRHQQQRTAILGVNTEARHEALKHLEVISPRDFPLFSTRAEHKRFHDPEQRLLRWGLSEHKRFHDPEQRLLRWGLSSSRPIVVDWRNDIFHIVRNPDIDYYQYESLKLFAGKNHRLAVYMNLYSMKRDNIPVWIKELLMQIFSSVESTHNVHPRSR
ncbi:hypothetical protein GGR57DRAFT_503850 [Xylariaceae sp. FL1272]|nr:hypothetical protein GGR57DRAFT_503850 [Xylariaceae sp. FL1272]